MSFASDFTWGVSSSAYQIEGAAKDDEKGASIWDVFCRRPGSVRDQQTGDRASDHYHHYREDVELMSRLGVRAYRLSLSWARILPDGRGRVNPKGVDFYDRLLDTLLEHGIEPWVLLYHWDQPYGLFSRGGWLNPDSPLWLAEYAEVAMDRFSDRVSHWLTLQEPELLIEWGHLRGALAPGLRLGIKEALQAAHHMMIAHGMAVQVIRQLSHRPSTVSVVLSGEGLFPKATASGDSEALRERYFALSRHTALNRRWWLEPLLQGRYPQDALAMYGADAPDYDDAELATIAEPIDFLTLSLGHNGVDASEAEKALAANDPDDLYWAALYNWQSYNKPIAMMSSVRLEGETVAKDGRIHDSARARYLMRSVSALQRTLEAGIDVRGFFYDPLLDGFGWALGYRARAGLLFTDYSSRKRIPKDSFDSYRQIVLTNGACLSGNGKD
jgi:beta-glucosidase